MEINKIEIKKYISDKPNLSITKHKNTKYNVKDGFITYVVSIDTLNCPCRKSSLLCKHIIHVLHTVYLLDTDIILFFHKLSDHFYLNISNKSTLNEVLQKVLHSEILGDDCAICMIPLIHKDEILSECNLCSKYCHQKCAQKWLDKNKNTEVKCVYCVSGSMIKRSILA